MVLPYLITNILLGAIQISYHSILELREPPPILTPIIVNFPITNQMKYAILTPVATPSPSGVWYDFGTAPFFETVWDYVCLEDGRDDESRRGTGKYFSVRPPRFGAVQKSYHSHEGGSVMGVRKAWDRGEGSDPVMAPSVGDWGGEANMTNSGCIS